MKQNIHKTDEQLWADIEAVFAANRPTLDEAEWIARTREVSDAEFLDCQTLALQDAERETTAGRHPARRIALWSAIAAAAVFVIVAGFGVVLHQVQAPSRLTAQVSPTNGTHKSHQWDTPVPPVGHADTTSRIIAHVQSQPETRPKENANTPIRKREHAYTKMPEPIGVIEEPSDPIEDIDVEEIQQVVYIIEDEELELEAQRQTMDELRARGERLASLVRQNIQNNDQR